MYSYYKIIVTAFQSKERFQCIPVVKLFSMNSYSKILFQYILIVKLFPDNSNPKIIYNIFQ